MMGDNITPEEKLLKIIENSGKDNGKNASGKGPAFARKPYFSTALLNYANIKLVNRLMVLLAVLLTIFLVMDFSFGMGVFKKRLKNIEAEAAVSYSAGNEGEAYTVNLMEAVSRVNKRNIFTLIPAGEQKVSIEKIQEETKNLRLVGIIWSDANPQAMVEDSKMQKTYILNNGEYVGVLQLKKIYRDKVVLGQGEFEWELR